MAPYFCTIKVLLTKPLKATEESGVHYSFIGGYYRNIGLGADGIFNLKRLLLNFVDDGEIVWDEVLIHDLEKVEPCILEKLGQSTDNIWYVSGRIFYPSEGQGN